MSFFVFLAGLIGSVVFAKKSKAVLVKTKEEKPQEDTFFLTLVHYASYVVGFICLLVTLFSVIKIVPTGTVYVPVLFGKVAELPLDPGMHIVNPLKTFRSYDTKNKTRKENAPVPSQDKLMTTLDVSVQYRIKASATPSILQNTGSAQDVIDVYLVPKLRSILREQGKGVEKAQDFFLESVQVTLQASLQEGLSSYMSDKGMTIDAVLIRGVKLPKMINAAINETKKREQEIIKQEAELKRFAVEQEKKIKTATSERDAAVLKAEQIKLLADAQAYKIRKVNQQLSKSAEYVKLKAVEQWDGALPVYSGGDNVPMIDLRSVATK